MRETHWVSKSRDHRTVLHIASGSSARVRCGRLLPRWGVSLHTHDYREPTAFRVCRECAQANAANLRRAVMYHQDRGARYYATAQTIDGTSKAEYQRFAAAEYREARRLASIEL